MVPGFLSCQRTFNENGLTLIEFIMAVAIFAIVAGLGVPMLSNVVTGNRAQAAAYELKNLLNLARSEAITRRSYITICPRKVGTEVQCGDDWLLGSILYRDDTLGTEANIRNDETQIIKLIPPVDSGITLTVTSDADFIRFTPRGFSSTNITFRFCIPGDTSERYAEEVVLTEGRVRLVRGTDTACH